MNTARIRNFPESCRDLSKCLVIKQLALMHDITLCPRVIHIDYENCGRTARGRKLYDFPSEMSAVSENGLPLRCTKEKADVRRYLKCHAGNDPKEVFDWHYLQWYISWCSFHYGWYEPFNYRVKVRRDRFLWSHLRGAGNATVVRNSNVITGRQIIVVFPKRMSSGVTE